MKRFQKILRLSQIKPIMDECQKRLKNLLEIPLPQMHDHVTELHKTLANLDKIFEQYRGLSDNALEGIFLITTEGQIIDCNQAFAEMLGYDSVKELLDVEDFSDKHYFVPEDHINTVKLIKEKGKLIHHGL